MSTTFRSRRYASPSASGSPLRAFEFFTAGIDKWWPKSTGSAGAHPRIVLEPFVGGRWYNDSRTAQTRRLGTCAPGSRATLVVSWEISAHWQPEARVELASEVEVRFVAEGETHTRVEVEHRAFERMGAESGETMRNAVENGWPGVLQHFGQSLGAVAER